MGRKGKAKTGKFLCEPKMSREMDDKKVLAKANAAVVWCEHATGHATAHGGKPWTYLLIPHDQISEQMSLAGLAAGCTHTSQAQETGSHGKE